MENIITSLSLLLLSLLSGFQVEALDSRSSDGAICMVGCLPPYVLHPTECRCIKETDACPRRRCPLAFVPCDKLKIDANGCETCECQCSSLLLRCPADCPFGTEYITDSDGCRVCQCQGRPQLCPQIRCAHPCPTGFLNDSAGCPSCTCKPRCPPVCLMRCRFGHESDQNGCKICKCKANPHPPCGPSCRMACPFGNVLDERGCPLCECKPRPNTPKCGPVCAIFCPNGNVLDARGCPTC